jgi:hypothetical protein
MRYPVAELDRGELIKMNLVMKRLAHYFTGLILLLSVWIMVPMEAAAQCPMCKAAVESGTNYGEGESWLASMLNTGIFYLFALPYLAIMGVGLLYYRGYRRRKREEAMATMTTIESVMDKQEGGDDDHAQ